MNADFENIIAYNKFIIVYNKIFTIAS
jgi:hypothetical protein